MSNVKEIRSFQGFPWWKKCRESQEVLYVVLQIKCSKGTHNRKDREQNHPSKLEVYTSWSLSNRHHGSLTRKQPEFQPKRSIHDVIHMNTFSLEKKERAQLLSLRFFMSYSRGQYTHVLITYYLANSPSVGLTNRVRKPVRDSPVSSLLLCIKHFHPNSIICFKSHHPLRPTIKLKYTFLGLRMTLNVKARKMPTHCPTSFLQGYLVCFLRYSLRAHYYFILNGILEASAISPVYHHHPKN
jgi:hypothetical protein